MLLCFHITETDHFQKTSSYQICHHEPMQGSLIFIAISINFSWYFMQYQCRVIILHGLQRKNCRKDGVLVCRSSNKSFQPTETGIEMIDTHHSQKTLYIHNHKRCWSFLSCRNPKRVHTNQSFFKTIKLSWIGKSLGIRWF